MKFSRRDNGEVVVDLGDGLEALASFVWSDVTSDPDNVTWWIELVEQQRVTAEADRKPLVGNAFAVEVAGDSTTVENQYDDETQGTYPTDVVLTVLREYRAWLISEASTNG